MNKPAKENKLLDVFISASENVGKIAKHGYKSKFYCKVENIALILVMSVCLAIFVEQHKFGFIFDFLSLGFLFRPLCHLLNHLSFKFILFLSLTFMMAIFTFFYGLIPFRLFKKYQKGIDHLDLNSGLGNRPKLLEVTKLDENRTKILLLSTGVGEERYKSKVDDLRASVGLRVEAVKFCDKDSTLMEIFFAKRLLENLVWYKDLVGTIKRPYSFVVGKSQTEVVVESLEDVPHYLVAGSTNGCKSVAFKSMMLGLLESSVKLQVFLFDFKRVEVNEFAPLPNVTIVKEPNYAQFILENLEREMDRRYSILERDGFKSIDPTRDNLNRIVVGIDECTDLTGKVPKSNPQYSVMERSRNSLDHLARKARACGIHLIFATQKIDSHSMDTRVQENVEGRLALRMNTIENSVRVLQNAMANKLPSVPGRAIWKRGANYTELQCPYITDEELRSRIAAMVNSKKFADVTNLVIKRPHAKVKIVTPTFTVDDEIEVET
ncbi:MAG: FtsK/SpoIIIE domain-containing protein [Bacteriovoracaceae bacterium]|nr:FtsK/SpoIIIE domain-containing protein [Bacteriovoracaceae bacterium]